MEQNKAGHMETGSAVSTELSVLVDRLKDEHAELKKSISRMSAKAQYVKSEQDLKAAQQTLLQLRSYTQSFHASLEQHSIWEESVLFPFLSRYFDQSIKPSLTRSLWTLEIEHELGDEYLQSFLQSVAGMKTAYDRNQMHAAADELIQACYILSKHLDSEEQLVFPMTDSILVDMDLLFS